MSEESHLTPEEQRALVQAFYAQTSEMLVEFGKTVLELEHASELRELLRSLERTVHTVKGDSMALELDDLAKLAHELEDYLRSLRAASRLEREEVDLLLSANDVMTALVEARCGTGGAAPDVEPLCERLVRFGKKTRVEEPRALHEGESGSPGAAEERSSSPSEAGFGGGARYRLVAWFARECTMHSAGAFLVQQRLGKVGTILGIAPDPDSPAFEKVTSFTVELLSSNEAGDIRQAARVPGITSKVVLKRSEESEDLDEPIATTNAGKAEREASKKRNQGSSPAPSASQMSEQLLVEVGKIDRIMNLVGELVIGRSMVAQAQADLSVRETQSDAFMRLSDANTFLERTLSDLQAAVLKIRMVPVEHVFRRFPRVVRDLAHASGKEVHLDVLGGLTELDKSIVDALGEPLLHLVRNAIDHGLEPPDEREASGKARKGRLVLQAFYEGNHVHIVVEDDGRGIDLANVAEKAIRLGIIEPSQLDGMTASEILNTIYHAGFSTRETVTDLSGRGIGMDVVRESIESLKGVIELTTAPGRGTRFLIRLPLTLAILRAVLVEVEERAFAVPLTGVLEIVRLRSGEARSVLGRGVLHWRDQVVPLVPLRKALGLSRRRASSPSPDEGSGCDPHSGYDSERSFVLLVGEAERRIGLVADRLLGEQELVVKPIEDTLTRSPGIAGASILGNGRVVLILHVRGLLDKQGSLARRVEVLH